MNPVPGILKKATVVPISSDHYPVSSHFKDNGDGRRGSASISFIASTMSMIPAGAVTDSPGRVKVSECELEEDLEPLADKNMVFIRQLPQDIERYINVPNKYQVVTSSGDKMFDVVETTDGITRRLFKRDQPFTMRILNGYGEYICELVGDPGVGGLGAVRFMKLTYEPVENNGYRFKLLKMARNDNKSCFLCFFHLPYIYHTSIYATNGLLYNIKFVKVKRESSIYGKVVQVNPLFACCNFSPTYTVHNDKGKTISRIKWQQGRLKSCMFSEDFQVHSALDKRRGLIGSISRQTKAICLEDYNIADTYALSFQDVKMDRIEKLFLVAAVIMLDFQFFEGREEGGELWKVAVCCFIVVLIILLLTGVAVYLLWDSAK